MLTVLLWVSNNGWSMYKVWFVVGIVLFLTAIGWYQQEAAPVPTDPPQDLVVSGYIFAIEDNQLLVAEGLVSETDETAFTIDKLLGDAYAFTLDEKTVIETAGGEAVDRSELELYRSLMVWVSGPVRESYPAQATADRIKIKESFY